MLPRAHSLDASVRRSIAAELSACAGDSALHDEARMSAFVRMAWPALALDGVSWVGFYILAGDRGTMSLVAREPAPACSPIGVHGACGQAALHNEVLIVHDVSALGDRYIACDPRDRSELVLPLALARGRVGVLDLDSHSAGRFGPDDATLLAGWLASADLSPSSSGAPRVIGGLPETTP
ncbi:MAG: GAF domain-containing protein [Planctomycetota bacterium]|nr:GAF domain-containing protein [Planctomycetota bacterium]MDA1105110.1 GAF domain-containing protein [Planctomycetota bacterium]